MIVEPIPEKGMYQTKTVVKFHTKALGTVKVAGNFLWDGASIPSLFWGVLDLTPFHPMVMRASCIHDWGYTHRIGKRRDWDEAFYIILMEDGMSEAKATTLWAGARTGGKAVWWDDEDEAIDAELWAVLEDGA